MCRRRALRIQESIREQTGKAQHAGDMKWFFSGRFSFLFFLHDIVDDTDDCTNPPKDLISRAVCIEPLLLLLPFLSIYLLLSGIYETVRRVVLLVPGSSFV